MLGAFLLLSCFFCRATAAEPAALPASSTKPADSVSPAPAPAAPASAAVGSSSAGRVALAKRVSILILNSYDPEYNWTQTIVDGIRKGIADSGLEDPRLNLEYLDARRYPALPHLEDFCRLLHAKYDGENRPDLIIAVDNAAYEFLRERGESLFGSIPVVFCGVSGIPLEELVYGPNVTGTVSNRNAAADTVQLIRQMLPQTNRLVFLLDYTPTGREMARDIRQELQVRRFGFESVEFVPDRTADEIAAMLAQLPPDAAVIHMYFARDKDGRSFSISEGAAFFSARSAVPVFGTLNLALGHGVVGGLLSDGEAIGRQAAQLAGRILRGASPAKLPLETSAEIPLRFDFRQLERFGIPLSALPERAEVFFSPPGLRDLYRQHAGLVWGVVLAFVLLSGTIILLLRQRMRMLAVRRKLSESQQLYSSLINDPPVCICRILPDGRIDYANDHCCQFFGRSREELTRCSILDFAPLAQLERLKSFLAELRSAQHNPVRKMEMEYDFPDGSRRYLRWINRAVFDANGRLETIQAIGEDISDLKGAYDVLIDNERRFRTVADYTCGWESWLSATGDILYISPYCETISGYAPKEFRQCPQLFLTTVFPDDRRIFEKHWLNDAAEVSFCYRLLHKSGRVVWVEYTGRPVPGDAAAAPGRRISLRDVTARKHAEEALRDNEENLRITMQSISDAVISTDLSGAVRSMNAAAEQLCGFAYSEVAGVSLSQALKLYHPVTGERLSDLSERCVLGQNPGGGHEHLQLRTPSGLTRCVVVSGAPIRNASQIVAGSVLVLHDVTRQVEMEQQLRHTQKMDAIGQLAGGVAHDFNNMLGGIMGAAELILAKGEAGSPGERYAEIILRTAERASRLTEQLLAFSRKSGDRYQPVDVHQVIREAREILASTLDKRISLQTWFEAEDSTIRGDAAQLENALINLCLNASDAMPDGGEVSIGTTNIVFGEDAPTGPDGQLPPGYYFQLSVSDTGSGIEPGILHKIFDPFFTTKEVGKGTGLGLSAVYGIVRNHHGAVTVASKPGEGATFHLYLPVSQPAPALASSPDVEPAMGEGTILLIDDEAAIRQTAALMLESCGYIVHAASGGQEGLELFRQNPQSYDLILLDMVMPDIDGAEVFRIMKSIRSDVRVIISSGYLRDTRIGALLEEGVCSYLKKPYRLPELAAIVAQVIRFGG